MSALLEKNEGSIDRALRIALGLGILSQAFIGFRSPWAYLGIIPLVTGALGSCPVYSLFGFRTCPVRPS